MVPNFHQDYIYNDHCWGRQSLLRTRWNGETLLPKEGLDFLLLQQQAVAIGHWCKFDTVVGGDGGILVGVVDGVGFVVGVGIVLGVADFVGFAGVGVTGIVDSEVFFVGLNGVGVSLVGLSASGVGVGGVGDDSVIGF